MYKTELSNYQNKRQGQHLHMTNKNWMRELAD